MAPSIPTIPRDQIKTIRDAAQNALNALWTAGKKTEAREIYAGMRAHVTYGWRDKPGNYAGDIAKARSRISQVAGGQAAPLNAYLSTDAKSLYDAKSDGFPAPPRVDPASVGSIGESLDATLPSLDITGFLSTLTNRNTWLRVGEAVLGLLLVGIGVAAITKGTAIGSAIRTGVKATPVGKVAKVLK